MTWMHPILWTRITERRLSHPPVKLAVLSTFEHLSFDLADIPIVFTPQSDLVILNYIANHIIQSGNINREFLAKHASFKRGVTNIGYGLRQEHPLEQAATHAADANSREVIRFNGFAAFVKSGGATRRERVWR